LSLIDVLVVKASEVWDKQSAARAIADAVADRTDMHLIEGSPDDNSGCVPSAEVETILESLDRATGCALVLVGHAEGTKDLVQSWLFARTDLAILYVDIVDHMVRITLRAPKFDSLNLDSLLTALRDLVEAAASQEAATPQKPKPIAQIPFPDAARPSLRPVESPTEKDDPPDQNSRDRSLLKASIKWVHAVLENAVDHASDDVDGLSVTRKSLLKQMKEPPVLPGTEPPEFPEPLKTFDTELDAALKKADTSNEPLAIAFRVFGLGPTAFRMMILVLAPELDIRYQRCIGFLLDNAGRHIGTPSLYGSLLQIPATERDELITSGGLAHWLVFEGLPGHAPAADDQLNMDPFLASWLLAEHTSLARDPRVRRVLRSERWSGASLLTRSEEEAKATGLIEKLQDDCERRWLLLDGNDPAGWRALFERGAELAGVRLFRAEPVRLLNGDVVDIEDCARRIARLVRLTGHPLIIDIARTEGSEAEDELLRVFFTTLNRRNCVAAVISLEEARVVRLIGTDRRKEDGSLYPCPPFELVHEPPLSHAARVAAVRVAAAEICGYITNDIAEALANRYPLYIDALEYAVRLARNRPKNYYAEDPQLERLTTALKELASEGVSHLVDRIEPMFTLDQVVLPQDRKLQLNEIIDNVRLAPRVLDEWKFRDQLPYGRGVTALFSGASGTGKTMSAMAVARALGIQLFRLDLSKVVSKYIGETEKNLDRVFTDAQASGAAILIDEADALLGKRSEVKDAHDRYANIEVAYLLQRMEAYEGLAILTTNMRKNLDAAFMRRLRFVVEFPRPDVAAREQIWRQCLPAESHALCDAEFRQLARRLDLTGGQIRQITVRAAFIAAAANAQISLEHVVQAARAEYAKLGMPPAEIDLIPTRRAA
jgi:AAA+ superfamily predicted ATPase